MSPEPIFAAARYWEKRYATDGRLWGDGPSELARLAVARLRPAVAAVRDADAPPLTLIDVGCGYGRDSRYLAAVVSSRRLSPPLSAPAPHLSEHALAARSAALRGGRVGAG